MLQIEHGVACLLELAVLALHELAVTVGQIDIGGLHLAGALRPEVHLLDVAVRNVLAPGVEVLIGSGNLDTALPTAGTEVVVGAGIVEHTAVDGEVVVVETGIHRTLGGTCPHTVLILAEHGAATTAETEADDDRLGIGSFYTEAGEALGVHLRIFLSGLVHGVGYPVVLRHALVGSGVEVTDDLQ